MLRGIDYSTGEEVWIPDFIARFIYRLLDMITKIGLIKKGEKRK